MMTEYPEYTAEEFDVLSPTILIELGDVVYYAINVVLEPEVYYWDYRQNKFKHIIYIFATLDPAYQNILLQELAEYRQIELENADNAFNDEDFII
jgi:hypothetical protein